MSELRGASGQGSEPPVDRTELRPRPVPASFDVTATGGRGGADATIVRSAAEQIGMLPHVPGVTLSREIGRGGMGVVYLGKQAFLDRQVAVKLLGEKRQSPDFLARFQREAKILAGLTHEHIVACYQSDITPDGQCFLVMEYVDGPNLQQWIEQNGPLEIGDALAVCRDLARALGYADERSIIHRDVKAENVLLSGESNAPANSKFRWKAKLTDLGLARPTSDESTQMNLTLDGAVMGTPASMAPEQFDDPQSVDFRADIYGLGCVFFQALTGHQPFPQRQLTTLIMAKKASPLGPNPRGKRPEIPEDVAELAVRMLAHAKEDRPQSYGEIAKRCDELRAAVAGARGSKSSKRALAVGAAVVVAAALCAGVWFAVHENGGRPQPPAPVELAALVAPVKTAREGDTVVLDGSPSDPSGSNGFTYAWKQIDGREVELTDAKTPRAKFRAPQAKEPYDLAFQLTTSKDGESALSPQIEAHVEAADDAPVVLADPVPAVDEGGTASLHADATDADGDAIDRFEWKQVGGPPVELFNSSSRSPTLIAPNAAADYALEFEVRAVTATNISAAKRVSVDVRAVNEPPRVTIEAPARGEAGESVVLTAHVEDPEQSSALRYEWSRAGDGTAIAFDDAHASTVHASLPEGNGDYPLEIALRVTDGSLAPVAATTSIAVASDAALAPLARGEMRVWIKADREVPIAEENSGPAGWDNPGDKLAFSHNGDGWLLASARNSAGALVRPLPRGEYEIAGLMESQGLKTKTCGVRFVSDDSHGVAVCIVSADDGARTVVSYATEKGADGAWSAPENTTLIGPWKRDDAIQFVFVWHKGELSVNWGKPGGSVSSQKLDIASRPRRIALFVAGGQSALFDWKIAGL